MSFDIDFSSSFSFVFFFFFFFVIVFKQLLKGLKKKYEQNKNRTPIVEINGISIENRLLAIHLIFFVRLIICFISFSENLNKTVIKGKRLKICCNNKFKI